MLRADNRFSRPIVGILTAVLFSVLPSHGLGAAKTPTVRAGVAVTNITADPTSAAVHDPLYAKALVVEGNANRVVIVTLDLIGASQPLVSSIRAGIKQELGIDGSHVLINAAHNHNTRHQLATDLSKRTVTAVRLALKNMVPVRIAVGVGREDRIAMNRRLKLTGGRTWTIRRANPSPPDADVVGVGPLDPEIGVLRLDRLSGKPLAAVYNYAVHAYGGVPDRRATAELPGFASAVLEEALGCPALFLQGAAGDITPVRYKDVHAPPPTERLGVMLGLSTMAAAHRAKPSGSTTVQVVSRTIELPRRKDLGERIKSLEREQDEILQFFTGVGCGSHGAGTFLNFKTFLPLYVKHAVDETHPAYSSYLYMHEEATGRSDLKNLDEENRRRLKKYLECIVQMERLIQLRSNLSNFRKQQQRAASGPIRAEVQGIRIGDFALVTFPGEPLAEIGLRIKKQSPLPFTFVAGYSNGHLGYAPTTDAYAGQAYEDVLTSFAPEWQAIYEATALDLLRQLTSR